MTHSTAWLPWALGAAVFAALTAILAKVGVQGVNSNFATLVRTLVVVGATSALLSMTGEWQAPASVPARSWPFLTLSGLATGASWLCYLRALQPGDASRVAPVDKVSVVLVSALGVLFPGEHLSAAAWGGVVLIALGGTLVALF